MTMMVRPERIRVSTQPPTGDVNSIPATVTDLAFQGPVTRVSLVAHDDSTVIAKLVRDQELPSIRPGDHVYASWTVDAARILPSTPDLERLRTSARSI